MAPITGVIRITHRRLAAWWGTIHMSFQLHLTSLFLHKNNFSLVASSPFSKHLTVVKSDHLPSYIRAFVTRFNIQHL